MQNKKRIFKAISFLSVVLLISIAACSSKKKQVVAEIGDEKIYLDDYEKQYLKTVNNLTPQRNTDMEQRKEFLELLIKFNLKVKDARERGLL